MRWVPLDSVGCEPSGAADGSARGGSGGDALSPTRSRPSIFDVHSVGTSPAAIAKPPARIASACAVSTAALVPSAEACDTRSIRLAASWHVACVVYVMSVHEANSPMKSSTPRMAKTTWKKSTTPRTLKMSCHASAKKEMITRIPSMRESRRSGRSTRSRRSTAMRSMAGQSEMRETETMERSSKFQLLSK